jgi:hypothetical protein
MGLVTSAIKSDPMPGRNPPKIQRFPATKQNLLDALLDKHADGAISREERVTLDRLVLEAQQLTVANARRLAEFAEAEGEVPPPGSVPVTVWVRPEVVKR